MMLITLLLLPAAPLLAQQAEPAPSAPAAAPAKPAKPKLICEEEETIGSHLGGHKVCLTAEQWRDQRQTDRSNTERAQVHPGG